MATNSSGRYIYSDMKSMTFWASLFIVLRLVGIGVYLLSLTAQVISGHVVDLTGNGPVEPFTQLAAIATVSYYASYLVSGIFSLIWIHGAARNALAIRPGTGFTPWGAVAWFFVPIANLFKPYQIMKMIWSASGGKMVAGNEPRQVQGWWVFTILGNIVLAVGGRLFGVVSGTSATLIVIIVGLGLIFAGTWLFLKLVRELYALQRGADTRVADTF